MTKKANIFRILIFSLVFLAFSAVSSYAATSDELTKYYETYGKAHGSSMLAPNVYPDDDYVDVSRGDVAISETDYVIKGKNGFEIPVIRRYNTDAFIGFEYDTDTAFRINIPAYIGYYYINTTTGTRVLVGFDHDFQAYTYADGFVGIDETTAKETTKYYPSFYHITSLEKDGGTCVYERDKSSGPVMITMTSYGRYEKQTLLVSDQYINLGSGWAIPKPGLSLWGVKQQSKNHTVTYVFHDINGKSMNIQIQFYDDDNLEVSSTRFDEYHRDYSINFVDTSNVAITSQHPEGFAYNCVMQSAHGVKYYFKFTDPYNSRLLAIEDRFGNTFLYANASPSDQNLVYVDCSNNVTYRINASGVSVTANGDTTQVVNYTYESITAANDAENRYFSDDVPRLTVAKLKAQNGSEAALSSVAYSMRKRYISDNLLWGGTTPSERNMLTGHYITNIKFSNGLEKNYSYGTTSREYNKHWVSQSTDKYDGVVSNKKTYSYTINFDSRTDIFSLTAATINQYKNASEVDYGHWYTFDSYGRVATYKYGKGGTGNVQRMVEYEYNCTCFDAPPSEEYTTNYLGNYTNGNITANYTYAAHRIASETLGDSVTNYTYGSYAQLTQISTKKTASTQVKTVNTLSEDKKSVAKTEVYDGSVLREKTTYACNSDGTLASKNVYQSDGTCAAYTYEYQCDSNGNITTVETLSGLSDADGNALADVVTQTTTDIQGNVIMYTDGKGNITRYEYDLMNRPVKIIYPDNTFVSYSYDDITNTTEATDALGNKIRVKFDPWGNREETAFNDGLGYKIIETVTSDYRHRMNSYKRYRDDSAHDTAQYTYDYFNRPLTETVTDSDGNEVRKLTYTYAESADGNNRPILRTISQVSGGNRSFAKSTVVTNYLGHPVSKTLTDTSGNSRVYSYVPDYLGNVLSVTAPDSSVQCYTYDHVGNVLTYTNQLSDTMSHVYDLSGNNISSTDFNGNTTNTCYDLLGRPVMVTSPLTQTDNSVIKTYYDANGNITRQSVQTDSQTWRNTDYVYDNMNRLSYVTTYPDSTTTEVTQYFYDANGNVTHMIVGLSAPVSNVNQIPESALYITYSYDALGRCIATGGNLSVAKSYEYDYAGNVTKLTKPMGAIVKAYDPFGNAISIAELGASSPEATYSYNALGLRTSMTDDTGTTTYTYDDFGNLLTETNGDIIKTSTYDIMGNRLTFAVTKDGASVVDNSYTYDLAGRMSSVTSNGQTVTYTYDANGNVLSETGATHSVVNTYNSAGMLESVLNKAGDAVVSEYSDIAYDFSGFMTSYADSVNNSTVSYTYDGNGRLKTETNNGVGDMNYMILYNYDLLGNRASVNKTYGDATTENYIYTYSDYNQLSSLIETDRTDNTYSTSYLYNTNGDMIGKTKTNTTSEAVLQQTYAFDVFGKMTQSTTDGIATSYAYDGDGIRQSKTTNDITTSHILDGMNVVADINGTTVSKYNRGLNLFAQSVGDEQTILYHNQHGDIAAQYASADDVNYFTYDGFGNHTDNASISTPFGYTGEYQDLCSGLIYLRNRYYDPSIGRFITEDPARDGLNWYVYCRNNPIKYIDPTGYWATSDSKYSSTVQAMLLQLTVAWHMAPTDEQKTDISNRANEIRETVSSGFGAFLDKGKSITGAAADEFSWFLGGDVSGAERDYWLSEAQKYQSDIKIDDKTGLRSMMFIAGIISPSPDDAWRMISKKASKEMLETVGEKGAKKFIKSISKYAGAQGTNGIKKLQGSGIKGFMYEVKVKGVGGAYRLLGNKTESGEILWELFEKTH